MRRKKNLFENFLTTGKLNGKRARESKGKDRINTWMTWPHGIIYTRKQTWSCSGDHVKILWLPKLIGNVHDDDDLLQTFKATNANWLKHSNHININNLCIQLEQMPGNQHWTGVTSHHTLADTLRRKSEQLLFSLACNDNRPFWWFGKSEMKTEQTNVQTFYKVKTKFTEKMLRFSQLRNTITRRK